ncbi:MAG: hypothetical protein AAF192_15270 [Pseudomonadota bacterium]
MLKTFAAAALLALAAASGGAAQGADRSDVADLFEVGGVTSALEGYADGVVLGARQGGLPPGMTEAQYADIARRVFDAEPMLTDMIDRVAERVAQSDVDELLDWLATPIGRRIAEAQMEAAETPLQERVPIGLGLIARDDHAPRLRLYRELIEAQDLLNFMTRLTLNTSYAVIVGRRAGVSGPQTLTDDQIARVLAEMEAPLRSQLEPILEAGLAYAYRDIDMAALEEMREASRTPASSRYVEALMSSIDVVIRARGLAFGEALSEALTRRDL